MLKLLKYECRKGVITLLIMLAVTVALEAYFLYGLSLIPQYAAGMGTGVYNNVNFFPIIISSLLLFLMIWGMMIFAMVRGVTSYSGELRKRSVYLIFMTPNSTLKIVASKFLYTFLLTFLTLVIYGAMGFLDLTLLLNRLGAMESFLDELNEILLLMGVNVQQIVLGLVIGVLLLCLNVLNFCAVAYFAITLSHTIFRDKSWRWLMAVLFYFAINFGLNALNGLFPQAMEQLTIIQQSPALPGMEMAAVEVVTVKAPTLSELLIQLIPQAAVSVGTVLASLFGCAWMLKKKVSL